MDGSEGKLYQFRLFQEHGDILHGVTSRSRSFDTQTALSRSDASEPGQKQDVFKANQALIRRLTGKEQVLFLNQVHGKKIAVLKKNSRNPDDPTTENSKRIEADAVITDIKDLVLAIQVADCQSVMMYDPENKVVANVHSGWRGSIRNIIGACVRKMAAVFDCSPGNIIAGISPSLGPCCSEFINFKDEIPSHLWKYRITDTLYFDFWKMSCDQLTEAGIKKIENMEICTKCRKDRFYSYRGEKTSERFAGFISMV